MGGRELYNNALIIFTLLVLFSKQSVNKRIIFLVYLCEKVRILHVCYSFKGQSAQEKKEIAKFIIQAGTTEVPKTLPG